MASVSIKMQKSSIPLVKSAILREKNILKRKLELYEEELKKFEKKRKMSSKKFLEKFNSGELGDDEEWFAWEATYHMYMNVKAEYEEAKRSVDVFLD
ncbi:MAG: hypothetical protein ABH874_05685 [Methanobacteriota archaeon]